MTNVENTIDEALDRRLLGSKVDDTLTEVEAEANELLDKRLLRGEVDVGETIDNAVNDMTEETKQVVDVVLDKRYAVRF